MQRLTSDSPHRAAVARHWKRVSRVAATTAATAVIGGMLAVNAPSAGAAPASGMVSAWGDNSYAAARSGVVAISAEGFHAVALKADGSLVD